DEVDLHDLLEHVPVAGAAVALHDPAQPSPACAVHESTQRCELDGSRGRGIDGCGVGHVTCDEVRSDLVGHSGARGGGEVEDDDTGTCGEQMLGRGEAEAGSTSGDEGGTPRDIHSDALPSCQFSRSMIVPLAM